MRQITVGDTAPDFDMPTDGGGRVRLSTLQGQAVVLYFYPKDDTSGCTTEALDFTALDADFKKLGACVIGVSKDSVKAHDKFKAKHTLSIILGADETGSVCDAYGTWVEKSMYGRTYMGIERATVLIDPAGRIAQIWRKVKVPGHAAAVLKTLQTLSVAAH